MDRQRLDKWLWHARVVKTRSSAVALVEGGRVRIAGTRQKKPSHPVKTGDVLTISLDNRIRVMRVTGFADRRSDAPAARLLYNDMDQSPGPKYE